MPGRCCSTWKKWAWNWANTATVFVGYVRMLANLSAIIQFLPEDLRDFSELHPEVKTDLEERPSNGVVQGVLDGVADLGDLLQ